MSIDLSDTIAALRATLAQCDAEISRLDVTRAALRAALAAPVPTAADAPAEQPHQATPKMHPPKPVKERRTRSSSIDYAAVAAWINQAKAEGTYSQAALADAFGRPVSSVKNWPGVCRSMGLLDAEPRATTEPITRVPFSEQVARDAVAGPAVGKSPWTPHTPAPARPSVAPTLKVSVGDARAMLDEG